MQRANDLHLLRIRQFAESKVGAWVRISPHEPWMQIMLVVPSGGRDCWLVAAFDGSFHVWPVEESEAAIEFRENTSTYMM